MGAGGGSGGGGGAGEFLGPDGQPPKRPRIKRNRYPDREDGPGGVARRVLDFDPAAVDRLRRKD